MKRRVFLLQGQKSESFTFKAVLNYLLYNFNFFGKDGKHFL